MQIKGLQRLTLLDYPGKLACTVFLGGCNFRCPFCHNAALVLPPLGGENISEEEFFSFLESRRGRLEAVCISGGEPTLNNDLPEFISRIRALGFSVKLDTNGTNPELLSALISGGLLDYVAMDIKSSPKGYAAVTGAFQLSGESPEGYSAVTGALFCDGETFEKVRESAEILMRGAVDFEFRTTLVRELHTAEDIRAIGEWLSGEEKFFLQNYRAEGEQIVGGFTPFSSEEGQELLKILRRFIPKAEFRW
jgi:pyruvate formate lyase activating enzyme